MLAFDGSLDEADSEWEHVVQQNMEAPNTPSSAGDDDTPPSFARHSADTDSDEEYQAQAQSPGVPKRKPGGYDSRIEQILYENPELPILITDAGKSLETGGKYIVYTIRTGVRTYDRAFLISI